MKHEFFDRALYIETFGCQMNVADSEVIAAVLGQDGYHTVDTVEEADAVILNTCSIRDAAERRVMARSPRRGLDEGRRTRG